MKHMYSTNERNPPWYIPVYIEYQFEIIPRPFTRHRKSIYVLYTFLDIACLALPKKKNVQYLKSEICVLKLLGQ